MTAIVMAGGKATRMKSNVEKPLMKIGDRTMLERVLSALSRSKHVDQVLVAVSANTPQTALAAVKLHSRIIETPGDGYGQDMQYAIKKLHLGETLIVSADLPFLTGDIVDRAIDAFRDSGKPALSVMTPETTYKEMGLKPEYVFEINSRKLVPIGLNLVDGTRIDEPELDQEVLELDSKDLTLNVNAPSDYELARQFEKTRRIPANE
jgi:adenosylcobinamide-phosphate guanylyltransferase